MSQGQPSPVIPLRPQPALAERDDDALMVLTASEHRPAFEALASRYLRRLAGYCAKFLGDACAGEEVAQEVLLEIWRQRARYRGRGRFQIFLFTIARNRCRNRARDEGRRRASSGLDGTQPAAGRSDGCEPLDRLLELERERRVREAMMGLPARLREAVLLRFDQRLAYAEMAGILRRPEATVRSRVFHALRRLRAELEEVAP